MQKERALRQLKKIAATALSLFMVLMNVSGTGTFPSYADEGGEEQILPDGAVGSGITISSDSNATGSNALKKLTAVSPLGSSSDADYTLVFDADTETMYKDNIDPKNEITATELLALGITITDTNGSAPYILGLADTQFKTTAVIALDIEGTNAVTIDVSGECSITSGDGTIISYALCIKQAAVTFTGDGTLTLQAGSVTATSKPWDINSAGMYADNTAITFDMDSSGGLIALGGTVTEDGFTEGINAMDTVTVNGGTVTAYGGDLTGTTDNYSVSMGVAADTVTVNGGNMLVSGLSDAAEIYNTVTGYVKGSNTYKDENKDNYKNVYQQGEAFYMDGTTEALTVLIMPPEYSLYFDADKGIIYKDNGQLTISYTVMTAEDMKKLGITVGIDFLKFDNTQFSTAEAKALVIHGDEDINVTIEVEGTCSLTSRNEYSDSDSEAIECFTPLTITGNGTLTVNDGGAYTSGDTDTLYSYGLYSKNDITVNMGDTGKLTVNSGNINADGYTIGIGADKVSVKGGSVISCGGTAAKNEGLDGDQYGSVGLWCESILVSAGSIYASGQSLAALDSGDFSGTPKGSVAYMDPGELPDAYFSGNTFYTDNASDLVKTVSIKTWEADGRYNVRFDPGVGDCKTEKMLTDTDGTLDDPLPAATINGSEDYFLGWFTAEGEQISDGYVFTEDMTLYARYRGSDPYSITFDPNGGTIGGIGPKAKYSTSTGPDGKLSEEDRNIYARRREGNPVITVYGFLGWFTEKDAGDPVDLNSFVFTKDTTLYAHWTLNEFTVVFHPEHSEATCTPLVMCTTNQKLSSLPDPTCSGYTFKGWYMYSGEVVTVDTTYSSNTDLLAKWEFTGYPAYTVTFNANGGTCDTKTAQTDAENRKLSTLPTPVRDGFSFTGWYSNGFRVNTGKQYDGDTTLTAHWVKTPVSEYVVLFDAANDKAVCSVDNMTTSGGKLSFLPVPTLAGYTFNGWFTEQNGKGTKITTDTAFTADGTVYASWTANAGGNAGESGSDSEESSGSGGGTSYRGAFGEWQHNSIGYWYRNADGTWPANEWKKISGKWYHFDENGYMQTGWIRDNGTWYYLDENGAMVTGLLHAPDGHWYYFWTDGSMAVGDVTVDGKRRHFNDQVPPEPTYVSDPDKGTWIPNGNPDLPYGAEKE